MIYNSKKSGFFSCTYIQLLLCFLELIRKTNYTCTTMQILQLCLAVAETTKADRS